MEENKDIDTRSIASDFSILPEATEVEAMSLAQPYLAAGGAVEGSATGSYKQVEFLNVCNSYPANQNLVLHYRFTADHKPSVTDRLALYRVGFTSPQHYLVYEWAPREPVAVPPADLQPNEDEEEDVKPIERIFAVTYAVARLPRDAAEFYQVCYVSEQHTIRGVSSPFQLVQEHSEGREDRSSLGSGGGDVVTGIVQPDGTVLVNSDVSSLHSNINMLQACVQRLQEEKNSVEEQLAEAQLKLQGRDEQVLHLEEQIQGLSDTIDRDHASTSATAAAVAVQLQALQQERQSLENALHAAREELDRVKREEEQHETKLKERALESGKLQQELEATLDQLRALQDKQKLLERELQDVTGARDDAVQRAQQWIDAAAAEKNNLNILEDRFTSVDTELREHMEILDRKQNELEKTREELVTVKEELARERCSVQSLQQSTCQQQQMLAEAGERQRVLDEDNATLQRQAEQLRHASEELQSQLRDSSLQRSAAERVAQELSLQHQQAMRECALHQRKSDKIKEKCDRLATLILAQNNAQNLEALVDLHDLDSDGETCGNDSDVIKPKTPDINDRKDSGSFPSKEEEEEVEEELSNQLGSTPVAAEVYTSITASSPGSVPTTINNDNSVSSSLVALELSNSVDGRMSCMLEEVLCHVKQMKAIMEASVIGGSGIDVGSTCDSDIGSCINTCGVVTSNGDISEEKSIKESVISKLDCLLTDSVVVVDAVAVGAEADAKLVDGEELKEEIRSEVVEQQTVEDDEDGEVFLDAPSRLATTVINIETEDDEHQSNEILEQTTQQQQQQKQPEPQQQQQPEPQQRQPEPQQQQDEASEQKSQSLPQNVPLQQAYVPNASVPPPYPYPCFGPVFTAGTTAPVFFPPAANPSTHHVIDPSRPTVIPLPYPPAFPVPSVARPHSAPSFPSFSNFCPLVSTSAPSSTGFHPSGESSTGLPPPLQPEVTDNARYAALLSTIGAAAAAAATAAADATVAAVATVASASGSVDETSAGASRATPVEEQQHSDVNSERESDKDAGSFTSNKGATNDDSKRNFNSGSSGHHQFRQGGMNWTCGSDDQNGFWTFGTNGEGNVRTESCSDGASHAFCFTGRQQNQQSNGTSSGNFRGQNFFNFMGQFVPTPYPYHTPQQNHHNHQHHQHHQQAHNYAQQQQQQQQQSGPNTNFRRCMQNYRSSMLQRRQHMAQHRIQMQQHQQMMRSMMQQHRQQFAQAGTETYDVNADYDAQGHNQQQMPDEQQCNMQSQPERFETQEQEEQQQQQQQQQLQEGELQGQELPEQYHDTPSATAENSDETPRRPSINEEDDDQLHCPMCPLKFSRQSAELLTLHIESHLENICPVCNTAFQAAQEELFRQHVDNHFDDDENEFVIPSCPEAEDVADPSGPWGPREGPAHRRFMETD